MGVAIGGEKAWKVYKSGDVGVAFHWINEEPAMCLFPLHRTMVNAGSYVICLSAAFNYVNSNGHPNLEYMVPAAIEAAKTMGFNASDSFVLKRIVDAICDGMPDLVEMPPEPENLVDEAVRQETVGELTMKLDGKTIAEKEVSALDAAEMGAISQ